MGKEAQTMETVVHFMEQAAGAFAVAQEAAGVLSDVWISVGIYTTSKTISCSLFP